MKELRTDRLLIRPSSVAESDLARLADLYAQPELLHWLGEPPSGGPGALVARWAALHEVDPRAGCWALEPLDGSPIVGIVLLKPLPDSGDGLEVGWHLHPDSWGCGYATEAAAAVLQSAFCQGLPEVYATVRPGNERSIAVCHRLGMARLEEAPGSAGSDVEYALFRLSATPVIG